MKRAALIAATVPVVCVVLPYLAGVAHLTLCYRYACRSRGEVPRLLDFVLNGIILRQQPKF